VIQMNTLPTGSTRAFILFMRPNFTFPIFELGEESVVATVTFGTRRKPNSVGVAAR
jgi:hypothetical protein